MVRELRPGDFDPMEKFWTRFPLEGSKCTPPHQSVDFKWKDYCPMVFRYCFFFFFFNVQFTLCYTLVEFLFGWVHNCIGNLYF